jgi:hypothetical protein
MTGVTVVEVRTSSLDQEALLMDPMVPVDILLTVVNSIIVLCL